jgi:hypothetical protein
VIVGRVSDHIVIKWRRKRKGVWYPEDRLRAAVVHLAAVIPLSLLAFGLVNRFVDGNLGLVLSLVCLFVNGGGVSGQALLDIRYYCGLINDLHPGGYHIRHLRCVSGRRNAVSKFRNLDSNKVCTFDSLAV